jgi:hypothetical protein
MPTASAAAAPTWASVATAGSPPAREDHTWTVAPDGRAYLFGGRDGTVVHADLWAYDLVQDSWTALDATGPPARFGHNAVWVDGVGLVIFAGQAGSAFYDDLWAYDPAADAWRQLPANGAAPTPRYGSCAALSPLGQLWISHGFTSDGTRFSDTRAYDFTSATWTDLTPDADLPVARCLHACWWTDDARFSLHGGQTTGVAALGDWWTLDADADAWVALDGDLPPDRNLHASARSGAGTVIFGGQALDGAYLGDAWHLSDVGAATPLNVGATPPGRAGAELIADPDRDRLLLFGGRDASGQLADTWALTLPSPG